MSRTLTEVGPTLRMTLFRDEQRRRLTRLELESRLAARGGSGLSDPRAVGWFVGWFKLVGWLGSTRALRPVVREEGRADPVREVRLVENIHWGVTRGPAKFCLLLMRCFNKDSESVESDQRPPFTTHHPKRNVAKATS